LHACMSIINKAKKIQLPIIDHPKNFRGCSRIEMQNYNIIVLNPNLNAPFS
jgi:hypothetical protein